MKKNILFAVWSAIIISAPFCAKCDLVVDTLWIQPPSCFWYGDPRNFSLEELSDKRLLIQSELYYELILDEGFHVLACSPFFSLPREKRPWDSMHFSSSSDSLYFIGSDGRLGISIILNHGKNEDAGQVPGFEQFSNFNFRLKHGLGIFPTGSKACIRKSRNCWWIISNIRLIRSPRKSEIERIPFCVIEVKYQSRKWKARMLVKEIEPIKLSKQAIENPQLFSVTKVKMNQNRLYWSDFGSPYIYELDLNGKKVDSILLESHLVDPNFSFVSPSKSDIRSNVKLLNESTSYYSGFMISNDWIVRRIWSHRSSGFILLVLNRLTNMIVEIRWPYLAFPKAFINERFYFDGERHGDRIAFPYVELENLIENSGAN